MQVEQYIKHHAQSYPDKIALICKDTSITYAELWDAIQLRATEMNSDSKRALVVRASQSIDFLITYFATHVASKAIVPLEHDYPEESLNDIIRKISHCIIPDEVADILYTTGTTGKQKGTMISHRAIIADAENLIESQQFSSDLTFIICGPLNHIGSLSKIWPTIMVGGTIHILEGIKDMDAFFQAIRESKTKIASFLVPASIRMILLFGKNQLKEVAHKIDFIETGAAPISQSDMEAICEALPNSRLYNTYASTETGIITTHNFNDGYCIAGCLGRPMKHASISFTEEGLIRCAGKTLMSGYVGDEELTRSVLRDGICYTNDRGELDSEGRLQLTGREGDIINIGGFKINPVEVEDVAMSFQDIEDCICITSPHPVLGTALRLLVETTGNKPLDKKQLGRYLMSKLEKFKVPQMYSQVESIKRTYNGKLDRKYYKQQ